MRYVFLSLVSITLIFFSSGSFAQEHKHEHEHEELPVEEGKITNPEILSQDGPYDTVYGDEMAKVRIVEYASLSCSHCKAFYETVFLPVKEKYIDAGKVKFIYRHFPLNYPALRGAQLVECVSSEEKKRKLIGALFKAQEEWAYADSEEKFLEKLGAIAKIGGIKTEEFNSCFANKELEEGILEHQVEAGKGLSVSSTPTIFINGEKFLGERTSEGVEKEIEKIIGNDAQ